MALIARILLSALFLVSGATKLTDRWDHIEPIKQARDDFKKFSTVFPLVSLGIKPDPVMYRTIIGILEVALAIPLLLGSGTSLRLAAFGLMVVMAGAAQTLICLGVYSIVPVPVVCFLGLFYIFKSAGAKAKQD